MKNLIKGLSLLLILFGASTAFAGAIKEYTADLVDVKSGQVVGKYAVTEKMMRMETRDKEGEKEGGSAISIIRMDHGKMYLLQEDKSYLEFPLQGDKVPSPEELGTMMMGASAPKQKREKLGDETVSGYPAEKIEVTTTIDMMGQTLTMTHQEWMAKEFDFPVRVQSDGDVMEMRNIKVGAPDAALFEIPAGYKKNTALEEMMQQMKQMQQGGKQ